MKQTAVDFLEEFLKQYDCAHSSLDYYKFGIPMHTFDKKIGQAKEMEKEQMIDFVLKWMGEDDLKEDVIKHYNETFKTNEK
jgi:hypothetical protein